MYRKGFLLGLALALTAAGCAPASRLEARVESLVQEALAAGAQGADQAPPAIDAGLEEAPAADEASPVEPSIPAALPTPVPTASSSEPEVLFASDFEEPDLFPEDGSLWTKVRLQTGPGQPESTWELTDEVAHSGSHSVKLFAAPGTEDFGYTCGKASFKKLGLPVFQGDTVEYSAYFYLTSLEVPVHLIDVECTEACEGLMGGPGVRVIMGRDGRLRVNWKFLNWYTNNGLPAPADAPPHSPKGSHVLPVGEWFQVTLRMTLDNQGRGLTEVYVNGELDLSIQGTNIAPEGLEALDRYSQLEVGINCNVVGNPGPTVVYVDDVQVVRLASASQE